MRARKLYAPYETYGPHLFYRSLEKNINLKPSSQITLRSRVGDMIKKSTDMVNFIDDVRKIHMGSTRVRAY